MKVIITIEMDNAAFEEDPAVEVGRIIRELGRDMIAYSDWPKNNKLYDYNGNKVGSFILQN